MSTLRRNRLAPTESSRTRIVDRDGVFAVVHRRQTDKAGHQKASLRAWGSCSAITIQLDFVRDDAPHRPRVDGTRRYGLAAPQLRGVTIGRRVRPVPAPQARL